MLIDVVAVAPQEDFQLDLEYANGERRRFDMKPLLAMKPWNRIASSAIFNRVRVGYGTVVWPGEIDIAPETLYDESAPIVEATREAVTAEQ
jgi:hypothetical protein